MRAIGTRHTRRRLQSRQFQPIQTADNDLAHECCPDCGLDRKRLDESDKRIEQLEKQLASDKLLATFARDAEGATYDIGNTLMDLTKELRVRSPNDAEKRIEAIEKSSANALETSSRTANGLEHRIAKLESNATYWARLMARDIADDRTACLIATATITRRIDAIEAGSAPGIQTQIADKFANLGKESANLSDQYGCLKEALDNAVAYLEQLAAHAGKRLGMSEEINYQPSRPILVDLKSKKKD